MIGGPSPPSRTRRRFFGPPSPFRSLGGGGLRLRATDGQGSMLLCLFLAIIYYGSRRSDNEIR